MASVVASCSTAARDFRGGSQSSGGAAGAGSGAREGSPIDGAQGGTSGSDGSGAAPGNEPGAAGGEASSGGAAGAASTSRCEAGETRTCAEGGILGTCATGEQACGADGQWLACSKLPASADTCVDGNDDNCDGTANEGCKCIEGVTTSPCGDCEEGTSVCNDGRKNSYGECIGAVARRTYYRDEDGDGYGAAELKLCSETPPPGYVAVGGDCCDVADKPGSTALPAMIHPGQLEYFESAADICGVGWDYDCSGGVETDPPKRQDSCCSPPSFVEADCGKSFSDCRPSCNGCFVTGPCGHGGWVKCR